MRKALTISLPDDTKGLVERLARSEGLTTSEYVRRAIFRQIWQDAATESQRRAIPRARARGVFTDEDVFRLIS
jgi:predicted transcriptional regulator